MKSFVSKLTALLRQYYVVGGMPAAVDAFAQNAGFAEVRMIQTGIVEGYQRDFAKHAPFALPPGMTEALECATCHCTQCRIRGNVESLLMAALVKRTYFSGCQTCTGGSG